MLDGTHRVLVGGSVFDGHRHRPGWGVLVESGRVSAVGPQEDVVASAGKAAVVDVSGGLVLPGFQDAHVHPVQGGLERIRCDLSPVTGRGECLTTIATYAAAHPDAEWILGGGWSMSDFPAGGPTAAELDAIVSDRPVFLPNRDHHGAWVNTRAMQIAGIGPQTGDPEDGRLERDAEGRPSGTLHEGAMALVGRHLPATTDAENYRAFLVAQSHLHSLGITAWQDAILGDYAGIDDPSSTYLRAREAGELTARVRGALWWDRSRGGEQVAELEQRRAALSGGRLHAGTVKIMQDGIAENFTAAMSLPYRDGCGCGTGNSGLSFVDPRQLAEQVTRLDSLGFQVHVHAIGDRAVRETLDAFEAALAVNGPSAGRHHVAHIQLVHPEDRGRFAELGVSANMQPLWAHLDSQLVDLTLPYLDPVTVSWHYPFADLARAGARLVAGSDWPVSSPDPLQGIHVAVNRCAYGEPGSAGSEVFLPEQRLTPEQAFAAYTSGSAYVNHLDDTGTLEPGRLADVVVLDRDPFAGDPSEIGAATVRSVYVDGLPVFES
jgi:predicted amidohydrolase YtcJ